MAPTLSVGRQMICMLEPKIFSFAVHRHVGLPDNLLSVEFRFYGAGAGSRHSWTGFPTGRLGGVRLSRLAVGYIHGAFMRRFRPTLPRFPGVVHTVVGMRTFSAAPAATGELSGSQYLIILRKGPVTSFESHPDPSPWRVGALFQFNSCNSEVAACTMYLCHILIIPPAASAHTHKVILKDRRCGGQGQAVYARPAKSPTAAGRISSRSWMARNAPSNWC